MNVKTLSLFVIQTSGNYRKHSWIQGAIVNILEPDGSVKYGLFYLSGAYLSKTKQDVPQMITMLEGMNLISYFRNIPKTIDDFI